MELNGQTPSDSTTSSASKWSLIPKFLFIGIPAAIISLFIAATPPGLWEKARLLAMRCAINCPIDPSSFTSTSRHCARAAPACIWVFLSVWSS